MKNLLISLLEHLFQDVPNNAFKICISSAPRLVIFLVYNGESGTLSIETVLQILIFDLFSV